MSSDTLALPLPIDELPLGTVRFGPEWGYPRMDEAGDRADALEEHCERQGMSYEEFTRRHVAYVATRTDALAAVADLWPSVPYLTRASSHPMCGCMGFVHVVAEDARDIERVLRLWHDHQPAIMELPRWRAATSLGALIGRGAFAILGGRLLASHPNPAQVRVSGRHGKVHRIAERQGWACLYCGVNLIDICLDDDMVSDEHGGRMVAPDSPKRLPTIDHLVPQSYGGSNNLASLALACQPCNSRKLNG